MSRLYIAGNAVDQNLVPVVGAQVYVRAGGVLATLQDAAGAATPNPIITIADGFFEAYSTNPGTHTLEYRWGGKLRRVDTVSDAEGVQAAAQAALAAAGAPSFPNTAAGLAGVGFGDTFYVVTAGVGVIYRKDAGPTATEISRFIVNPQAATGSSLVGFVRSGTGAVARTVAQSIEAWQTIPATDYGYVGPDADSAPAILRALQAANGKWVSLPAGTVRLDQRINYQTSGNRTGARIKGQGQFSTIIECNYDDDTENGALRIFGSLTTYQFQYDTELKDFWLRPAAGRKVAYGVDLTGHFRWAMRQVRVTGFRSTNGGFGAGLAIFNRPALGNPDGFAAVSGLVENCWLTQNHTGALLLSGQGAAGITFANSSIQENDFDGVVCPSVGGPTFIDNAIAYNGALITDFTAATTNGASTIVVSGAMPANMVPGREIRGPGIPSSTVVASVSGSNVVLCQKGSHRLGSPALVNATATNAAAPLRLMGGYGVSQDGPFQGSVSLIRLVQNEMDGNTSGAAYFVGNIAIEADGNRVITRVLDGEERSLDHFVYDRSQPNRLGNIVNTTHRVDVVLTEQNDAAVGSAVTLYNGGTTNFNLVNQRIETGLIQATTTFVANTTNGSNVIAVTSAGIAGFVAGQLVTGAGIPAGTSITSVSGANLTLSANATATATGVTLTLTVPVTIGTAIFSSLANRNSIKVNGTPWTVAHEKFYMRATPTQGFTTTQTSLKANAANTGWPTPDLNTTGQFRPGFNGTLRIRAFAVVADAVAGDNFRVRAMRNGVLAFDWQSVCPANASRFPVDYDMDFSTVETDVWTVEVFCGTARSIFGPWQLVAEAVS